MNVICIENKAVKELKRLMARYGFNVLDLSLHTKVAPARFSEVFRNKRRITTDTDLRLCHFFKLKQGYFLKYQMEYDLELKELELGDKLAKIKTVDEIIR